MANCRNFLFVSIIATIIFLGAGNVVQNNLPPTSTGKGFLVEN